MSGSRSIIAGAPRATAAGAPGPRRAAGSALALEVRRWANLERAAAGEANGLGGRIEPERGERPAPDTAGVEARDAVGGVVAERRPVPEDDACAGAAPPGDLEPRSRAGRGLGCGALEAEQQPAVGRDDPQPRQAVDRETQAFGTGERVGPPVRPIAVHRGEEAGRIG